MGNLWNACPYKVKGAIVHARVLSAFYTSWRTWFAGRGKVMFSVVYVCQSFCLYTSIGKQAIGLPCFTFLPKTA